VLIDQVLYVWMLLKPERTWQSSPDSSGYAAWSIGFCRKAAAFERI